jgi:PAS domain S-box-containing protein
MKTLFEGKKLYAVIIVLLFAATSLITFFVIHHHYELALKAIIKDNRSKAHFISTLISEYQKTVISILESYAQRPLLINAVKRKDFNHIVLHLKSLHERYVGTDALFVTDRYGTLWANYPVDKTGFGENLANRDWYKGVSRNWRPYVSSLYRLIFLKKGISVAVSVPIFDGNGKVIGILGNAQRRSFFVNLLGEDLINPIRSIALLDKEGNVIFSNTTPYEDKITKYHDEDTREKAVAGVSLDMEVTGEKEKGGGSYISVAPLRGIGWSIIVGYDKDAILKELYGHFILSAVTGFTIFLFLTVSLLYFRKEYIHRKTKELLVAEERYRRIFENALEGIYQTTPEGRYLNVNPAFVRIFGFASAEEMMLQVTDIGKQLYVNPEDRDRLKAALAEQGQVEGFEAQVRRKDGSTFWISLNAHAVRDGTGKILYYEGTNTDITGRKQAEEEVRKLNVELEQRVRDRTVQLEAANKELEAFSYSVSHDLRAPLRSVDGFSRIILEEYGNKLDDTLKNYLGRICKGARHMGLLIDDLLKLAQVTRSEFHYESIDLSGLVGEIAETLRRDNPERIVDVVIQEGINVKGDPYLIKIALGNLLDNAWKFTGKERQPRVLFGATVEDGETIYFIKDNGAGFDMTYTGKLFGAFQRLHTIEEFPGTGIGLATVRRIITRHGGHIWAEGEVGKGATFYFTV